MITNYKIFEDVSNTDIILNITRYESQDFYYMTYSIFNDVAQDFIKNNLQKYNSYNRENSNSFRTWLYKLESLYFQAYLINYDINIKYYLKTYNKDVNIKIKTKDINKALPKSLEHHVIYKFILDNIDNKIVINYLLENDIYKYVDKNFRIKIEHLVNAKNFDLI